jgi:hypothetical protein
MLLQHLDNTGTSATIGGAIANGGTISGSCDGSIRGSCGGKSSNLGSSGGGCCTNSGAFATIGGAIASGATVSGSCCDDTCSAAAASSSAIGGRTTAAVAEVSEFRRS